MKLMKVLYFSFAFLLLNIDIQSQTCNNHYCFESTAFNPGTFVLTINPPKCWCTWRFNPPCKTACCTRLDSGSPCSNLTVETDPSKLCWFGNVINQAPSPQPCHVFCSGAGYHADLECGAWYDHYGTPSGCTYEPEFEYMFPTKCSGTQG